MIKKCRYLPICHFSNEINIPRSKINITLAPVQKYTQYLPIQTLFSETLSTFIFLLCFYFDNCVYFFGRFVSSSSSCHKSGPNSSINPFFMGAVNAIMTRIERKDKHNAFTLGSNARDSCGMCHGKFFELALCFEKTKIGVYFVRQAPQP